jgi:hypothetical protein
VFLRTDLWRQLDFTNKTHLVDRQVTLSWSKEQLSRLLVKGAMTQPEVVDHVSKAVPAAVGGADTMADGDVVTACLQQLLPDKAYPGEREADIIDWIFARVTDASGTAFPREAILLGNRARTQQLARHLATTETDSSLIGREALTRRIHRGLDHPLRDLSRRVSRASRALRSFCRQDPSRIHPNRAVGNDGWLELERPTHNR